MIDYKDCEDEDDDSIFLMDLDCDPESKIPDEICPFCGNEYDEIDYEYQICHYCKYKNK